MITAEQLIARFPTAKVSQVCADRVVFAVDGIDMPLVLHRDTGTGTYALGTGERSRRSSNALRLVRDYLACELRTINQDLFILQERQKYLLAALDLDNMPKDI
jgi:hypothetical protein